MDEGHEYCSVFRSDVDDRVWMCNIPYVDVATGLQASTSLRKVKAYVEEVADRHLDNFGEGHWSKTFEGTWNYCPEDQRRG